jgi:hypothetical protein
MTVNYRGQMFYNMVANLNSAVICNVTLTLENVGTTVNYHGIFKTLASGLNLFHSFKNSNFSEALKSERHQVKCSLYTFQPKSKF